MTKEQDLRMATIRSAIRSLHDAITFLHDADRDILPHPERVVTKVSWAVDEINKVKAELQTLGTPACATCGGPEVDGVCVTGCGRL